MKEIRLNLGFVTIVDDADWEWLSGFKWFANTGRGRTVYAYRNAKVDGKWTTPTLHREIAAKVWGDGFVGDVDHIDRDGLNNVRSNLRLASRSQNKANGNTYKNNTVGYKGVYWRNDRSTWRASVSVNGRRIVLGCFKSPEEAARAYDRAALEHFGPFARLNFPERVRPESTT